MNPVMNTIPEIEVLEKKDVIFLVGRLSDIQSHNAATPQWKRCKALELIRAITPITNL